MRSVYDKVSDISVRALYLLTAALLAMFFLINMKPKQTPVFLYASLGVTLVFLFILFKRYHTVRLHVPERYALILLLLCCFLVKLIWVLCVQTEPKVDYLTFYETAEQYAQTYTLPSAWQQRYISLFPHIFGYASFLGVFFDLFGTSPLVAVVLNVVLSVIQTALIYYVGKKTVSHGGGILAGVIWILLPSQTIYNMYVLSEPLYTTGILVVIALLTHIRGHMARISYIRLAAYGGILSLVLVLTNMVRPLASILLIALLIWLFLIDNKDKFGKKAVYSITVLAAYLILLSFSQRYVTARIGAEITTLPGYNIYVGFNQETAGTWNEEDSNTFFEYVGDDHFSAPQIHQRMFQLAKERVINGEIDYRKLFVDKFDALWGDDSACVGYAYDTIPNPMFWTMASNVFYYILFFFALLGAVFGFLRKSRSATAFAALYFIGLTLGHMFTEVALRYHYSGLLSLTFLSAYGICIMTRKR